MIKKGLLALLFLLSAGGAAAQIEVVKDSVEMTQFSRDEEIRRHRCQRGLVNLVNAIVPKGHWIAGVTGSYSAHSNDNYMLAVIEGVESMGYTIDVSPMVSYALADNLAVGVRFEYGRSLLKIDDADLVFGEDINLSVIDYYALQNSYTLMGVMRQYIPLGNAKRFAFFSEVRVHGGYFQSKYAFDRPVSGTFSEGYSFGIGVVPGIVAFATNDVAFEVTVGMLGVGYTHTSQVHNQVYTGEVDASAMNFKVNLLSIGLGVSFYI